MNTDALWRQRTKRYAVAFALALGALSVLAVPTRANARQAADGPDGEAKAEAENKRTAPKSDKRIVISIDDRRLWLIEGRDTLMSARVAVGRTGSFTYKGKTYNWQTPRGQRKILSKEKDRLWTPPDWHYYEKAASRDLEAVKMEAGKKYELSDGTHLEIRDGKVGRVNEFGNFWPWTPGMELIFDGKIFVPPLKTEQRKVPDALGSRALHMGDGYFIHGTWKGNRSSIGTYASHGCVRMYNEDIKKLYDMVSVGTPVHIQ